MLQKISSVFVVYRSKTLTGSPDPTHAIGTDKPCRTATISMELTEKTGRVQVTFGSFGYVEKYFVRFKPNELDDTYTVSLYKDARYMIPFQEETFTSSDVCGLDWGTFELQKKVLKYFYKPSKLCTYLTIITKTKSISFVFSGDEGEQCKEWKNAIQKFLYKGRTYIREKLKHEGDDVMLQIGNLNIALTKRPTRRSTCLYKTQLAQNYVL